MSCYVLIYSPAMYQFTASARKPRLGCTLAAPRKGPEDVGYVEGAMMFSYSLPEHVWHHHRCSG